MDEQLVCMLLDSAQRELTTTAIKEQTAETLSAASVGSMSALLECELFEITPLLQALDNGMTEAAAALLQHGADYSHLTPSQLCQLGIWALRF